jgi:hypothetical protein
VNADFSNFDAEVAAAIPDDWAFEGPNPEVKAFTKASRAKVRFPAMLALASTDGNQEITLQIYIGAPKAHTRNSVQIIFSSSLETEETALRLSKTTIASWDPSDACVGRTPIQMTLNQPIGSVRVGWLTYFADKSVNRYLPTWIRREEVPPGVLVFSGSVPGLVDDTATVENMKAIISALNPHGLLKGNSKATQAP